MQRVVSFRLQLGTGDRRKCSLATVRTVRSRTERQGNARSIHAQVQGFRLRNDDQLRWGVVSGGGTERVRSGQPCSAGFIQKDEEQWRRPLESSRPRQRIFIHVQPLTRIFSFYWRSNTPSVCPCVWNWERLGSGLRRFAQNNTKEKLKPTYHVLAIYVISLSIYEWQTQMYKCYTIQELLSLYTRWAQLAPSEKWGKEMFKMHDIWSVISQESD